MRVLSIASTGMMAQQLNVEVISNNIANINTTAFKRGRAEFQDLMYQSERRQGSQSTDAGTIIPTGIEVGLGVRPGAVNRINTTGNLTSTGNELDLAIEGRGYFNIRMPAGETAYTRAGGFKLSPEGTIVTSDGHPVLPEVTVPQGTREIAVNASGEVQAFVDGQTRPRVLGQLVMTVFVNESGLEAMGDNLFRATPASGEPQDGTGGQAGFGTIRQKYLESSNVNVVQEITELISAQRAYEMNAKVVEAGDQMASTLSNMR
ncbi:flagellar basal-body rod protein FlgG [Azospirillum brasilense]|uniref:Flagellar basal-body rod protein FlgG n=2 Tax=Azospirillum TaxID=191 RepID=A0A4D8QIV1_AZOBR|nr:MULTISPECIES: flagellar basal-body rod protein FlgG [Azospirillum]QCO06949.1 flagellar basal-body rod protein FlgG [Azospirillum argentinense]TWA66622.1 flagellar basal-body rod protein FlgG [Azospirillum brasilense]